MSGLPRLKLLMLTPQLPYPPEQGTSLRNYHIVRGLAQFHDIHLLSFIEPQQRLTTGANPLNDLCAQVVTVPMPQRTSWQRLWRLVAGTRPDMAHRLRSEAFERALRSLLNSAQFDVVQVEGIELATYIRVVRRLRPNCAVIFDNHNAEAELQRRMFATDLKEVRRWPAAAYSFIQWRRLRRFERWVCRNADGISVVSDADRSYLKELAPGADPMVIPNCIDVKAYKGVARLDAVDVHGDLLFIGKMDYRPNVDAVLWFGREIWPRLREARPQLTWAVVGKQPHPRLKSLAGEPGVCIIGEVPQIKPYLARAIVYVMPFRIGSGTRLKLIEAMASGVAMVSTRIGAEGYPLQHDRHLLLADEPQDFADAVLSLLDDEERRRRLQKAGREFAGLYDWRRVVPRFNALYSRLRTTARAST